MGNLVFKKLAQKLSDERERLSSVAINPIVVDFDNRKNLFLNKMSENAVKLYEHQSDVKKFTNLVLSDPENKSHNKLVDALFSHGLVSNEDDEKLLELSDNTRFLRDLGLID